MFEVKFKDNMITRVDSRSNYPIKADNYGSIILSFNQNVAIFNFSIKMTYTKDNPLHIDLGNESLDVIGEFATQNYPGVVLKLPLDLCMQARTNIVRIVENDIISLEIKTPYSIKQSLYKKQNNDCVLIDRETSNKIITYLSSISQRHLFLDGGINLNLINMNIYE